MSAVTRSEFSKPYAGLLGLAVAVLPLSVARAGLSVCPEQTPASPTALAVSPRTAAHQQASPLQSKQLGWQEIADYAPLGTASPTCSPFPAERPAKPKPQDPWLDVTLLEDDAPSNPPIEISLATVADSLRALKMDGADFYEASSNPEPLAVPNWSAVSLAPLAVLLLWRGRRWAIGR